MNVSHYYSSKQNKSVIMFSITFNGYRVQTSTGISIDKSHQDKRFFVSNKDENFQFKRQRINLLIAKIHELFNQYETKNGVGTLTATELKNELKKWKPTKKETEKQKLSEQNKSILIALENYISLMESGKMLSNKNTRFAYRTIREYKNIFSFFKSFSEQYNFSFESINDNFKNDLLQFGIKRNLKNNTLVNYLKALKTFLNYAYKKGYHSSKDFESISLSRNETDLFALNEIEIKKLIEHDFENKLLHRSKILFLVQFFTGQRYSDLKNINEKTIDFNKGIIKFNQQKTNNSVIIPITAELKELLKEFLNIKIIESNLQNKYLKEIFEILEINEPMTLNEIRAGKRTTTTKPKFQFIGTHTARRSFITISLLKGIAPQIIMKVTGHKNFASFEKYVKFTESEIINIYSSVKLIK